MKCNSCGKSCTAESMQELNSLNHIAVSSCCKSGITTNLTNYFKLDFNNTQRLQLIRCAFQHLDNCYTELRNANRDRQDLHKVEPRIYFVAKTLKDVNELLKGI